MIRAALIPAKAALAREWLDEARRARAFVLTANDPRWPLNPSMTLRAIAAQRYELAAEGRTEEL